MDALATYVEQAFLDVLVNLFEFIAVGILLTVLVWLISYLVYACIRWLRG